ncbi:MAG: hypothetical protein EXQ89_04765 [Rhodospirillaceae bacterium]|nr:hypothetical protein [Rhodospirillaceae bacterium]
MSIKGKRRNVDIDDLLDIECRDYWFKIVEFLQTNWAATAARCDGHRTWAQSKFSGSITPELHVRSTVANPNTT